MSTHLILLDLITRTTFGEKYCSLSSSLCSFLYYLVTISLLGPNVLLSTLFSNILSLHSSLSVSEQDSHSCKIKGKIIVLYILIFCRSQWPRGLRRRSTAAHPLRLWVRIPPGAWMFVCCECCVLSGRGLCDGLITRPEESYRLWSVVVCDQGTSNEEAKAGYGAVENTTTMGCNANIIYRVSQEEWTKLRESVPYVELYRYNPKHLYSKLNGYGDNGQRSLKL